VPAAKTSPVGTVSPPSSVMVRPVASSSSLVVTVGSGEAGWNVAVFPGHATMPGTCVALALRIT